MFDPLPDISGHVCESCVSWGISLVGQNTIKKKKKRISPEVGVFVKKKNKFRKRFIK